MADNKIQMPGAFGGLMRYDEEYKSRFMISPNQIIGFVVAIAVLVILLKVFFPQVALPSTNVGSAPLPAGNILPLLLNLI